MVTSIEQNSFSEKRKQLLEILSRAKNKKFLVWGDLIYDEYIYGDAWRISREAPVLILKRGGEEHRPGGAGNAVCNLLSLGALVSVMGIVGKDTHGERVLSLLKKKKVDTTGVLVEKDSPTISKVRIMASGLNRPKQQVVRIDSAAKILSTKKIQDKFSRYFQQVKENFDGILISDYSYGTVIPSLYATIASYCAQNNTLLTVDSRFDLLKYKNATLLTPNEEEAAEALGLPQENIDQNVPSLGRRLLHKLQPKILIITRGKKGMDIFQEGKPVQHIPIHGTDEVTDVTGAGDTVASISTLALACGATPYDAAILASYAAGIVVMKMGVASVTPAELEKAIENNSLS